ncbi:MAG: redoxin domain-containing protein [Terracidiphilus sp.]
MEISLDRRRFLANALMTIGAARLCVAGCANAESPTAVRLQSEGEFPLLSGATGWLNSQPLTARSLRGSVVLVNFSTFSCINSIRVFPYLRAWAAKYKNQGLVVVGVQAPEFEFEKSVENIRWAVKDRMIDYPIAIDNDLAIWRAFNNEYWPALYFIDARGHIRHHQFGEGEYEQSESVIQELLADAGAHGVGHEFANVEGVGIEAAPDWADSRSPESYVGYDRAENFASSGGQIPDKRHVYICPSTLKINHWALSGDWTARKQSASLNLANGRIAYRFHARDLHLIMGSSAPGSAVRFRVTLDGQPTGIAHGVDVDAEGKGKVTQQRLYHLIRQPQPIVDRQFEIEFLDPGVETFDFTFG